MTLFQAKASFKNTSALSDGELYVMDESGQYMLASDEKVFEEARKITKRKCASGTSFEDPSFAKKYFLLMLRGYEREVFAVAFLNSRHQLIEYLEMFFGSVTQTSVYPREIIKVALHLNASAIIVSHIAKPL